jgi:hypothetical protein
VHLLPAESEGEAGGSMTRGRTYADNACHMHHGAWALAGASGGTSKSEGWSAHVLLLG